MTKIAIGINYFNRPDTIGQCLESLFKHRDGFDIGVHIIEAGSEKHPKWRRLKEHYPFKLSLNTDNKGIGWARHFQVWHLLYEYPDAEYILIIDDDFMVEQGYFSSLVEALETEVTGAVGGVSDFTRNASFYQPFREFWAPVPYENMMIKRIIFSR